MGATLAHGHVRNNAHRALQDTPLMRAKETWRRRKYSGNTGLAACNVSLELKPPSVELARARFLTLASVQFVLSLWLWFSSFCGPWFGFSSSRESGEVQPSYLFAPKPHAL